jgi:hypothetical protein
MSLCSKCEDDTRHIILALAGGLPKQVECRTCDFVHPYRMPTLTDGSAVDYSPTGTYHADQVLRHKTFGLGVITSVGPTRIVVTFEDKQSRKLILTAPPPK